jgi:hypothetical protein
MTEQEHQAQNVRVVAVGRAAAVVRTYPDGSTTQVVLDRQGWQSVINQIHDWLMIEGKS